MKRRETWQQPPATPWYSSPAVLMPFLISLTFLFAAIAIGLLNTMLTPP